MFSNPRLAAVRIGRALTICAMIVNVAGCRPADAGNVGSVLEESPFEEVFLGDDNLQYSMAQWDAGVQDEIVRCMSAAGFTYAPRASHPGEYLRDRLTMDDGLWAERHGYGSYEAATQQALADDIDPNLTFLDNASHAERVTDLPQSLSEAGARFRGQAHSARDRT